MVKVQVTTKVITEVVKVVMKSVNIMEQAQAMMRVVIMVQAMI